jgi:mediator of RNA polymerase II transcription subunit 12
LNASSFLINNVGTPAENDGRVTAAVVQKYLTVIDLTSAKVAESTDQLLMLPALVERLKGISQALTSLGTSHKQAQSPAVLELYAW